MILEIKHLAGYLPYKVLVGDGRIPFELTEYNFTNVFPYITEIYLRPISDLTEWIEVNGEHFIPINVIGEDVYMNICDCDYISDWCGSGDSFLDYLNEFIDQKYGNHHLNFLPFGFVQKLLEWHFDIYGLIEAGLAIDINTLNS